jgi:hypothetical protein
MVDAPESFSMYSYTGIAGMAFSAMIMGPLIKAHCTRYNFPLHTNFHTHLTRLLLSF